MTQRASWRERLITGLLCAPAVAVALLLTNCGQTVAPAPAKTGSTLCYADYQKCVNPIFDAVIQGQKGPATCAANGTGCHAQPASSGGGFKIFQNAQPDSPEMLANFYSTMSFANLPDPPNSKLLLKPDAAGRAFFPHGGGNIFPTTTDVCYVAIKTWISNSVKDANAATCGQCTAPVTSNCGY
jgi:hypothetical protein